MYIGGIASLAICVYIVYLITAFGDTSLEWVIWVFFGLTVALIGGGFYAESDYKKKHPRHSEFEDLFREGG